MQRQIKAVSVQLACAIALVPQKKKKKSNPSIKEIKEHRRMCSLSTQMCESDYIYHRNANGVQETEGMLEFT